MLALPAGADRLGDILLDYDKARAFAHELAGSVVLVRFDPPTQPDVEPLGIDARLGFAAVIDGPKGQALIASGALAEGAVGVDVRAPSGRWSRCRGFVKLGDGAAVRLDCGDPFLWLELTPLPVSTAEAKKTTPLFTIGGVGTANPSLHRGVVMEELEAPLAGAGTLMGINYCPHPKDRRKSMAVSAETLRAWLRTEGSPTRPR